ncbi:MAG: CPBP family intramembrane metalloprotease [Anaerolineales bacterium]|nr:MAG: CPBP family intramembrane metalloprotease [Anaerolineales bacterium]
MRQHIENTIREMSGSDQPHFQYTLRMLVMYFVLTFVITWSILIPTLSAVPEDSQTLFLILAAFGPFISAVITIRIGKGRVALRQWLRKVFRLRIPVILYLAGALFLPFVIGGLHYGLYSVLGGKPDFSTAESWVLYPVNLLLVALLLGGNEEPGWRGFALPALLERFHPVLAAIVLGAIHSAWHLPLLSQYGTTFGWYLFNLIPLTVVLKWFYLKSRKSVIPVMLLHASTNVIGNFVPTPVVVLGGLGTWTVLRGLVYWAVAIVIVILTRGNLGYESTDINLAE